MNKVIVCFVFLLVAVFAQPSLRWPDKWRSSRNQVVIATRVLQDVATYYVDATQNALRMDIEQCTDNSGKNIGWCSFYFVNNNTYYLQPAQSICCLAIPNLGPTPPDWIEKLNHTFLGASTYLGERAYSFKFTEDGTTWHYYYLRVSDPRFPFAQAGDGSANEYFNSQLVDRFDPTTFKLPSATCANSCPSAIKQQAHSYVKSHRI
eukprot:TRINITY_DN823_c0_g1_i1.p1 TRINITY_DN823_c0_g1~~TRINITY_DN823_c0_g1_i1.p1  ORF type:complete len:206 (-),score=30.88 TRINITY_DN823_c0_g1_i1:72-689(-)